MSQSKGYAILNDPDNKNREFDTLTCNHCQRIILLEPGKVPEGGWCFQCSKMVCNNCVDKGCTPWEKKMEQMEAKQRMLRSVGL